MNISLIGMMGSGKTTIAKKLALLMPDFTLVDIDSLIVKSENCSINEIFEKQGESAFRKIESKLLNQVLNCDNQIISTGGGVIKSDENISVLKQNSITFYLKADEDTLFERVKNNKERPLLNDCDMQERIKLLLAERKSQYEKAHITIDTTSKTPDIIANEIVEELKKHDKCKC